MENKRFRNHILSLLNGAGAAILFFVYIIITDVLPDFVFGDETLEVESAMEVVIPILALLTFFTIFIVWKIVVWSKTWIIIEDGLISEEKKTISYHKNTIGIKNISNVNNEQNLLEIILGISKVKINTDSQSTADTTDMTIVLKKAEAIKLKEELLIAMEKIKGGEELDNIVPQKEEDYDIVSKPKDIILHSLYSLNVVSIVSSVIILSGIVTYIGSYLATDSLMEKLGVAVIVVILLAGLVAISIYQFAMNYLKIAGFSTKRTDDKLYIKYGIIKQVDYSIPVERINSLIIKQTFIARVFHKYMVEIINIGMGDEKEENACLCFYSSKEDIINAIDTLLPEMSTGIDFNVNKQPKSCMWIYALYTLCITAVFGFIMAMVLCMLELPVVIVLPFALIVCVFCILCFKLKYKTRGIVVLDKYFGIRTGTFATKYQVVEIKKVQRVQFKRDFILNKLGLSSGFFMILAKLIDSIVSLPYIDRTMEEKIKSKLLEY